MVAPSEGLHVEGLSEAIRALGRVDKELGKAARDVVKDGAVVIQKAAQTRAGRKPGGGSYPSRRGIIGRSSTNKGGGIKLRGKRYPWAWGAEYGAKRAWVFGRVTIQSKLRRRQYPVWRGNQFVVRGRSGPGWLIQPAIRENLERVTDQIADGLLDLYSKAFDRAGIRGRSIGG